MRLKKPLTTEQIRQLEQIVFVGRLASEEELSATLIDQAVSFSDRTYKLTFYIKCLSEIPKSIEAHFEYPNKIFTANTNSYTNIELMEKEGVDFYKTPYIEIKEKAPKLFQDKLIIFRLEAQDSIVYANMEAIEEDKTLGKYYTLPGPKLRANETKQDLHEKLVMDTGPIILDYYPEALGPTPELIIHDGYIYKVDLENKHNPTTYFQREPHMVTYVELSEEDLHHYIDIIVSDDLYFVSEENYNQLLEKVASEGEHLNPGAVSEVAAHKQVETGTIAPLTIDRQAGANSEHEFIERFTHIARYHYRLFHEQEDLINLHTSIKTNAITILGGMSGTGKSQLARAYADALQLPEENLAFIPVSPSYQEPDDVLGYLNPQTGMYYESETGLVSLLSRAEADPRNLYMVVFDEMNLSQVEHWFSPFLSLLELKDHRKLKLFKDNHREINGEYKSEIHLYDNVIFVGTVNFDETTRTFSDRLLDRVNIIEPKKANFADTINFYESLNGDLPNEQIYPPITRDLMRDEWIQLENVGLHHLTAEEIHTLDELHKLINESDPQKGVSFRIALAIAKFVVNLPTSGTEEMIDRRKAFDYQINQRILTKINGIDSFVEPLVGHFMGTEYEQGSITDMLIGETAQGASDFTESLKTLQNKAKELSIYGFAN